MTTVGSNLRAETVQEGLCRVKWQEGMHNGFQNQGCSDVMG